MNNCLAKVLGGIACTIGVLALSMGVAHAEEKDQGRKLGAQVAVNAKSNVAATPKVNLPKAKVTVPRARVRVQSTQRRPAVRTQARANTRPRPIVRAARPTVRTQARPAARVKANIRAQARPAERVRSNVAATARRAVRSAPEVTAGVRKAARARVTTKAQPVRRTTAARRPVVRAGAQAKAAVVKRTSAKSTSSLRAKLASTPRLDEAVKQSPTAMADADAQVAGIPVDACARVNAGGCADTGPGTEPGGSTVVPMIAGDGTATAEDLANGTVCLRINGGDCGNQAGTDGGTAPGSTVVPVITGDGTATAEGLANGTVCLRINGGDCGAGGTDGGTGSGTDTTGTVAPRGIALLRARAAGIPVEGCARVNAGDCADTGSGTEPGGNTVVPVIAGDGTATAEDLANGTVCLRINGGDCGAGGTDGGTGGGTDTTGTVAPRGIALLRARAADILDEAGTDGGTGDGGTDTTGTVVPRGIALLRVTAADIFDGADSGTGDANRILSRIGSGVMAITGDVAGGVACTLTGGCGTDGGGSGGGSDGGSSGGGSDGAGIGGGGSIDVGFGGDGSVGGRFGDGTPVATVFGVIGFSDGGLLGQLLGGDVQLVTGRLALDPAGDAKDPRLAHTGSSAAMLGLLVGGLLSLLMAGPLLARRRRN